MLLAVFSDIHGNRQAFEACLKVARARGAERFVLLGDFVGYGADPEWVVDTAMGLVKDGAIAVRGNHDEAVGTATETMNAEAQVAIEWTRGRLDVAQRRFLAELPMAVQETERLYVHSEASQPSRWNYVRSTADAAKSLISTPVHVTFCGHIHRPALYSMSVTAKMTSFVPKTDVSVQLLRGRQWLAVLGAVGQPRDGDPSAAFVLFDTVSCEITYCRVPYDVASAATKIRENGLPPWLADRLSQGTLTAMPKPLVKPGAVIDGYTIGECVHAGGMATLWTVTYPGIDVPLLMKIPRVSEGEDPVAIVSFEMEMMILPRLAGPHVPSCFGTGDFAHQAHVVIERISGTTLYKRLPDLPLPYEEARLLVAKIAAALADLHRQNVIHHDIKPSSIMFRDSGEAVLIDYGLSHHNHLPDLLQEEFRLPYGTAPYMAPERLSGVRDDPRSDLFSLGVLLYFFTTGERPFGEGETLRAMRRRLWRDPHPPRKLRADYPPWLQEVVLRCLEIEPVWRYPTASQLAFDLTHPDQVRLTARSERMKRDPLSVAWRRRFNQGVMQPRAKSDVAEQIASSPILAVALDTVEGAPELNEALRMTTERILATLPSARLACVNVLKLNRIALDRTLDEQGSNKHIDRLVALRHWATPLKLDESRLSVHVLEAVDPAAALLEFAEVNQVDHVIIGARQGSFRRTLLGSVSAKVASEATCTVTVVRPPRMAADAADAGDAAR